MSAKLKANVRKDINEAITENIDSRASLKTIVASLSAKKGKQQALPKYINCLVRRRARPSSYFSFRDFLYPSQTRNAFSSEWDGDLNPGFFENLSFKSLMPWMINAAQNLERQDPVTSLLRQKMEWNRTWTAFKTSYWGLSRKRKYKWFSDNVLYCPKSFVDMAEVFSKNPDPHFTESYNWYYAGAGNLHVADIKGGTYILHSEFNSLYVAPFSKESLSIDYTNTAKYSCAEDSNILETTYSQDFVAVRTKHKIVILKLKTSEDFLQLLRLKEMDSELPFTSIKFDQFHKNILYVTTLDFRLSIVNLDRMSGRSVKLRGKFTKLTDNWSTVLATERSNYAHVSKKSIVLYDKRTNAPYQRWRTFKYLSDIQTCDHISAAKYCENKPLMYVATDHHLYLMDMRCGATKSDNMKPLQRWSHGAMCAPTYLTITPHEGKELVCVASQWFEDLCVVNNHSDALTRTDEIPGLSLPYRPPSLMQTFNEAHRKKLCYSMYDQIHERLCTAISGLATVEGTGHSILQQNSLGDISCHALFPKHMCAFLEDDSVEKLHQWCDTFDDGRRLFEVSYLTEIKPFLRYLLCVAEDYELGRNEHIRPKINFDEDEISETFDGERLNPEFLDIWKEKRGEITLHDTEMSEFFVNFD